MIIKTHLEIHAEIYVNIYLKCLYSYLILTQIEIRREIFSKTHSH